MGKVLLVLAVLLAHFLTRQRVAQVMPLDQRCFYSRDYHASLSLLAGHGFKCLIIAPDAAATPLAEFLHLKREGVSRREFADFCQSGKYSIEEFADIWHSGKNSAHNGRNLASTRVLDIYLAALSWNLFGINWTVLFIVYTLVSVGCCGLIFLTARRLSGSYWLGLFAAILFFASPLENYYVVGSIRDISPLWFTILCFYIFSCHVERFTSPVRNLAMTFCLGIASVAGFGWRFDALLLPPFFLVMTACLLIAERRPCHYILSALTLFLVGALATWGSIKALGPPVQQPTGTGFHIAFYGDSTRSNICQIDNSFQIPRSDVATLNLARYHHEMHGHDPRALVYLGKEYASICRSMYFETARYNLYRCLSCFPSFLCQAVHDTFDTDRKFVRHKWRLPWLKNVYHSLDKRAGWPTCLFFVGCASSWFFHRDRVRAWALLLFMAYYSLILFTVLPESKHLAPLLVPGIIIAAIWPAALPLKWSAFCPRLLATSVVVTAAALLLYGAACAVAHPYSVSRRGEYLRDIMEAARAGCDAPDTIRDGKRFTCSMGSDEAQHAAYLLTVRTGDRPDQLVCRHQRTGATPLGFLTRHRLHSNREQYFFVYCVNWSRYGVPVAYQCTVEVGAAAEITACRRVDVSHWKHLPMSTVFFEGERSPGSPILHGRSSELYDPGCEPADNSGTVESDQ